MKTRLHSNMCSINWKDFLHKLKFALATAAFSTLLVQGSAAPANSFSEQNVMNYLVKYGYLGNSSPNPTTAHIMDVKDFKRSIAEFQEFAGLNSTGKLDNETVYLMSLPRCGVKDKGETLGGSRAKRYALQGSRWRVRNLTYKISKYPSKLKHADVDKELARAFDVWSSATDLTFTQQTSGSVHIEIRFERGEHGDGDPFDGPGGTLAHAYFPVYGGDAHFDEAEPWSINSKRGTNLFQVAAHEFGHSLGLSHSDVRSALMAPFYRGYEPSFSLDQDDVEGIQALYGRRNKLGPGGGLGGSARPQDDPELCKDASFDTIFNTAEGATIVFKGANYWKLTETEIAEGYPRRISDAWKGLESNIDAAFTYKNGKTYFFKGSKYWRYKGFQMDGRYPKDISEGFTGIPDNVDAALVWSGNGKIYFYKGSKFWRFDPTQKPAVKSSYPKPVSNWEGIPNNIDAAFQYTNGYTYFFKNGMYWRFNDQKFSVDDGGDQSAFPRSTAHWWFGCKNAPQGTVQAGGNERLRTAPTATAAAHHPYDIVFEEDNNGHRNSGSRLSDFKIWTNLFIFLVLWWR